MEQDLTVWNIYVDETYISNVDERNISSIATGYYCIPENRKEEVYKKYQQVVYAKRNDLEIKSTMVSDQMHTKALQASRGVGAFYLIQHSILGYEDDDRLSGCAVNIATMFTNYLAPLEILVKKIKTRVKTPNLDIKVYLDEKNEFNDSAIITWFNYLANEYAIEFSSDKLKINIEVEIVDSQKYLGVQIADMLCGSYRRDVIYDSIEDHGSSIIPFKYQKIVRDKSGLKDGAFLKTYAIIKLNKGVCPRIEKPELSYEQEKISEKDQSKDDSEDIRLSLKKKVKDLYDMVIARDTKNGYRSFYNNYANNFLEIQSILGRVAGDKDFDVINVKNSYKSAVDNIFYDLNLYLKNINKYSSTRLIEVQKILDDIEWV